MPKAPLTQAARILQSSQRRDGAKESRSAEQPGLAPPRVSARPVTTAQRKRMPSPCGKPRPASNPQPSFCFAALRVLRGSISQPRAT